MPKVNQETICLPFRPCFFSSCLMVSHFSVSANFLQKYDEVIFLDIVNIAQLSTYKPDGNAYFCILLMLCHPLLCE